MLSCDRIFQRRLVRIDLRKPSTSGISRSSELREETICLKRNSDSVMFERRSCVLLDIDGYLGIGLITATAKFSLLRDTWIGLNSCSFGSGEGDLNWTVRLDLVLTVVSMSALSIVDTIVGGRDTGSGGGVEEVEGTSIVSSEFTKPLAKSRLRRWLDSSLLRRFDLSTGFGRSWTWSSVSAVSLVSKAICSRIRWICVEYSSSTLSMSSIAACFWMSVFLVSYK